MLFVISFSMSCSLSVVTCFSYPCIFLSYRILLTSTSEVYGDPLEHPQKEEYWGNVNPIGVPYTSMDFLI